VAERNHSMVAHRKVGGCADGHRSFFLNRNNSGDKAVEYLPTSCAHAWCERVIQDVGHIGYMDHPLRVYSNTLISCDDDSIYVRNIETGQLAYPPIAYTNRSFCVKPQWGL
jgi:hypothetical protein